MRPKPQSPGPGAKSPEFFSQQVTHARRFYLDLNPPKHLPLAVVCGGLETCAPDYAVRRSTFPYQALEFVAAGRGTVKMVERCQELRAGRVFCYGPGVGQEIATAPDAPLVKYFINFCGREAMRRLREAGLKPGAVVQVCAPNEIVAGYDELIHNGLKATRHSAAICNRLLEVLLLKIAESSAPSGEVESRAFTTYQHCRQHLRDNFLRLRTLEQAARECHVNVAHLCRLFQRFDHQSPYQLLLRLKMSHAAERLHEPAVLVKQVAAQTGFGDAFHFSRAFKAVFGVSPDAFRKLR